MNYFPFYNHRLFLIASVIDCTWNISQKTCDEGQQCFSYITDTSFIGRGNLNTQRQPATSRKARQDFSAKVISSTPHHDRERYLPIHLVTIGKDTYQYTSSRSGTILINTSRHDRELCIQVHLVTIGNCTYQHTSPRSGMILTSTPRHDR